MPIQTVKGPIEPDELGICACHEHLYVDLSHIKNDQDCCLQDEKLVAEDLEQFKALGGRTVIEVTNDGMGRNPEILKHLSTTLDLHIVASTGCYKDPFIPEEKKQWTRDQFAEWMTDEICHGIAGTAIKPGVIGEIGSSFNEFKPIESELFHGAIEAARQTGLPLSTHTTLGTCAADQINLFITEGLPLHQVIIGHQDLNRDNGVVLDVLKSGAYVALDTIGKENYRSDQDRLNALLLFLKEGYEDQLLLSSDLTRKSHLRSFGGQGYDVVLRSFVPALKKWGVSESVIEKLLMENPKKAFSIKERR